MLKTDTFPAYSVAVDTPRGSQLAGFFAEFFAGMREGREMEARYNALSHLSNTDLAHRGLSRATITRAILYGGAK